MDKYYTSKPATAYAAEVDQLIVTFNWICGGLLVAITVVMLYFAWRYRRSATPKTKQIHGHLPLELTWIIIPTLIVLYMFYIGYEPFVRMRTVPDGAMVIKVTAKKWDWTFEYPEHELTLTGTTENDNIASQPAIPVGVPVKFELTSIRNKESVLHSFYLPAFRVKEDCIPYQETYVCIQGVEKPTSTLVPGAKNDPYTIFCAEFCGQNHSKMWTKLHVLSKQDFKQWVADRLTEKNKPVTIKATVKLDERDPNDAMNLDSAEFADKNSDRGKRLFAQRCASCHQLTGVGGINKSRNFTTLDGPAENQKWKQGTKLTDIFRSISNGVPGTGMNAFKSNLSNWDRFALMHYVGSFYKGTDRPAYTAEDIQSLIDEYGLGQGAGGSKEISIEEAIKLRASPSPKTKP